MVCSRSWLYCVNTQSPLFSLHFVSYHFISPPPLFSSLHLSFLFPRSAVQFDRILEENESPFWPKSTQPRSHFTTPCSYEPCKCELKNDVCGAPLLLGFPKYSGQIVFARHYERHYPSFWMSSVIGIIGAKVQKLTLRVIALQVGLSDEIRGWVCTVRSRLGPCLVNTVAVCVSSSLYRHILMSENIWIYVCIFLYCVSIYRPSGCCVCIHCIYTEFKCVYLYVYHAAASTKCVTEYSVRCIFTLGDSLLSVTVTICTALRVLSRLNHGYLSTSVRVYSD